MAADVLIMATRRSRRAGNGPAPFKAPLRMAAARRMWWNDVFWVRLAVACMVGLCVAAAASNIGDTIPGEARAGPGDGYGRHSAVAGLEWCAGNVGGEVSGHAVRAGLFMVNAGAAACAYRLADGSWPWAPRERGPGVRRR